MLRYLLGRLGQAVLVLWLAYTAVFVFIQALPSDQLSILYSPESGIAPDQVERLREYYGLDLPVWQQYLNQLWHLVQGDFGFSISTGQPVLERIGSVVGQTIQLATLAIVFAVVIAAVVAYVEATTTSRGLRHVLRAVPEFFSAIPVFWLGLVVLQVVSVQLRLMQIFPDGSPASILVPPLILAIPISAPIAQVLLQGIDAAYAEPYVKTARAKGASVRGVLLRHIVKNVVGPTLTVIALSVGALFAGSVVTETVFSRTGLGSVLLDALFNQDIALVQGLVLLTAIVVVVANLIVDLLYPVLDPRILTRRGGRRPARSGAAETAVIA